MLGFGFWGLRFWGYIGMIENKMETTIVYWGYVGMMENETETTTRQWLEELNML